MPASKKAHQAIIKREFYAGATQAEALAAIRDEHGATASSRDVVVRAWKNLKAEAENMFKDKAFWTMEELRTKDSNDLRRELSKWVEEEMVPNNKKGALKLIKKFGPVGQLKAEFPLGIMTEAQMKKRDAKTAAKILNNLSSDQKRAKSDRINERARERRKEKKDGRYVKGESERDRDIADYKSLCERLKEDKPRWKKLRHNLKRKQSDFDPVQTYNHFDKVQTKCFWQLMGMFHRYVDSIGVENFHGNVEYVWNARAWLSIILRLVRSIDLDEFSFDDCWVSTDGYEENRPALKVRCNGKSVGKLSAAFACTLLNGRPPVAQKQNRFEASHKCHNRYCINPSHLIWESRELNGERSGCQHGASFLCPHQEACIFVNEDGNYLLCKNNPNKRECDCGFDCFDDFCNAPVLSTPIKFTPTRPDYSVIDPAKMNDPQVKKFKQMFDCLLSESPNWNGLPAYLRGVNSHFDLTAVFNAQNEDQRQAFQTLIALLELFVFARIQLYGGDIDFIWAVREWLQILFKLAKIGFVGGFGIQNCWNSELRLSTVGRPAFVVKSRKETAAWISAILSSNGDPTLFARHSLEDFRALNGSHRCSNGICVNPFHMILEESKENNGRKRCIHSCASLCPHQIKCIYQRKGVYLPCRNDLNKRQYDCELNCFALNKIVLDQVEDEDKSSDAESSNKLAKVQVKKVQTNRATTNTGSKVQKNVARPGFIGLVNLNNTCFMNSALQVLFNTPGIRQLFGAIDPEFIKYLEVSNSFLNLMDNVQSAQDESVKPDDFVNILSSNGYGHFFDGAQHDSQEFFTALIDKFDGETNRVSENDKKKFEQDYDGKNIREHAKDYFERQNLYSSSPVNDHFGITVVTTITCLECNTQSVSFVNEKLAQVELLESKHKTTSLSASLESYFGESKLTGEHKWLCPTCKFKQKATKSVKACSLPPVLVIHLKRFIFEDEEEESKKNSIDVNYTGNGLNLDMSPHLHKDFDSEVETNYELYAVTNHHGETSELGHYTSMAYNPTIKSWLKFNDQSVKQIAQNKVQNPDAYMLFYRRKDLNDPNDVEFDQATANSDILPQSVSTSSNQFVPEVDLRDMQYSVEFLEKRTTAKCVSCKLNFGTIARPVRIKRGMDNRNCFYHPDCLASAFVVSVPSFEFAGYDDLTEKWRLELDILFLGNFFGDLNQAVSSSNQFVAKVDPRNMPYSVELLKKKTTAKCVSCKLNFGTIARPVRINRGMGNRNCFYHPDCLASAFVVSVPSFEFVGYDDLTEKWRLELDILFLGNFFGDLNQAVSSSNQFVPEEAVVKEVNQVQTNEVLNEKDKHWLKVFHADLTDSASVVPNSLNDLPTLNKTKSEQVNDAETSSELDRIRALSEDDLIDSLLRNMHTVSAEKHEHYLKLIRSALNEVADVEFDKEKDCSSIHTFELQNKGSVSESGILVTNDIGKKGDQLKRKKPNNSGKDAPPSRVLPARRAKKDGRLTCKQIAEFLGSNSGSDVESSDGGDELARKRARRK